MLKLMKLEARRNSLRSYIIAACIITVVMVGFLYLFAALPAFDETEQDMEMFMSYESILALTCILSMASFAIMSSSMYAKFIVEEYSGKKVLLLFSYPVSRGKIFAAKVATVSIFTFVAMVISNFICFALFYLTESIFPICKDTLTLAIISQAGFSIIIYSLLAAALGLVSIGFGLWKKSISATIVAETIIVCVMCNFLAIGLNAPFVAVALAIVSIIAGLTITTLTTSKIKDLEV